LKNLTKYNKIILLAALVTFIIMAALSVSACGGNPLTFYPAQLPEAVNGQNYQVSITVTGNKTPVGQIGVDSGTLPAGLNLSYERGQNSAVISGTSQSVSTYNFTIGAWCMGTNKGGQTGHKDYTLVVK
jgi:hypothetical protein